MRDRFMNLLPRPACGRIQLGIERERLFELTRIGTFDREQFPPPRLLLPQLGLHDIEGATRGLGAHGCLKCDLLNPGLRRFRFRYLNRDTLCVESGPELSIVFDRDFCGAFGHYRDSRWRLATVKLLQSGWLATADSELPAFKGRKFGRTLGKAAHRK